MHIAQSWRRAFKLCKPHNLGIIIKETFSLMRVAIEALIAPWFIIPYVLFVAGGVYLFRQSFAGEMAAFIVVTHLSIIISAVLVLIAARSTHEKKDFGYFARTIGRVLLLALVSIIAGIIIWLMNLFLPYTKQVMALIYFIIGITPFLIDTALLYALDKVPHGKFRGFQQVWYNYPLYLTFIILVYVTTKLASYLVEHSLQMIQDKVSFMIMLVLVGSASLLIHAFSIIFTKCLTVALYNRRTVHPQHHREIQ